MSTLLRVENLSAGYGDAVVLNDIHLSLDQGQTLALLGRNGVGKTPLMDPLAGATRQRSGTIELDGVALHRLPSHARAAAGIMEGVAALTGREPLLTPRDAVAVELLALRRQADGVFEPLPRRYWELLDTARVEDRSGLAAHAVHRMRCPGFSIFAKAVATIRLMDRGELVTDRTVEDEAVALGVNKLLGPLVVDALVRASKVLSKPIEGSFQ